MRDPRISRRRFLGRAAFAGLSSLGLLAACAPDASPIPPAPPPTAAPTSPPTTAPDATAPTSPPTPAPAPTAPAVAPTVAPAPTAPAVAPTVAPAAREVTVAMAETMLTLDPADHHTLSTASVLRHLFDPLVDAAPDGTYVPVLAERWEVVDDLTWRLSLRKDVTFHDGTPFNAESVVYTIGRVRDDPGLLKHFVYRNVAAVEQDGEHGVLVKTKAPFAPLLSHLSMLGMLPTSARGRETEFFEKPVGTGPFKLVSFERGDSAVLAANERYWRSGAPKVQKATFRFLSDASTRVARLLAGEVDVIDRVPPDFVATLEAGSGAKVLTRPSVETQQWIFQHARPPVDNPRVRKAISLAIDRPAIVKQLYFNQAIGPVSPLPGGVLGHVDLGVKPHVPDEARALLKEADVGSPTIDFVLMKDVYPRQLEVARAVEAMLGDVGIRLNVRNLDVPAAREARAAGDFHLFYSGWSFVPPDPDWYFGQWFTKAGAEKLSRYNNPKVEALIAEARKPDPQLRQATYEEVQRILWDEEEAAIWPHHSVAIYATRDRIAGFDPRPDYYVLLSDVTVE